MQPQQQGSPGAPVPQEHCCHPPPTLQGQAGSAAAHHREHSLELPAGRGGLRVFSLMNQHLDWDALPKRVLCPSPEQLATPCREISSNPNLPNASLMPFLLHTFLLDPPLLICVISLLGPPGPPLALPHPGPINRKAELTTRR